METEGARGAHGDVRADAGPAARLQHRTAAVRLGARGREHGENAI